MTECTECGCNLELNNVEKGEIVNCNDCGAELEITNLKPVKLELAPVAEEDWGE